MSGNSLNAMLVLMVVVLLFSACAPIMDDRSVEANSSVLAENDSSGNETSCTREQARVFMNRYFGLNLSDTTIETCNFTRIYYGGGFNNSLLLGDGTSLSIYFSGMGSGGHGLHRFSVETSDEEKFLRIQEFVCSGVKDYYVSRNPTCPDDAYDRTNETVLACKDGLFSHSEAGSYSFSFTQMHTVCGMSVSSTFVD